MSEIVYYDANATVRALMTRELANYGLKVVELPTLEQCEDIFSQCTHPVIFIVDMSRQPEMLPRLQAVVPKYIRDPERCILTSVTPTALARYLPQKIDDCFFKHVVERPFKRLDFIQFFENIAHPYLKDAQFRPEPTRSTMNSSVSQITGQYPQQFDAGQGQTDAVIRKKAVALQQLGDDAGERNVAAPARRENRISKTGRSRAYAGVPEKKAENQTIKLSQEDDRKIRENLNAWRHTSNNRQVEAPRQGHTAIHQSRIEKNPLHLQDEAAQTQPVPMPHSAQTNQKPDLNPEMEVFENSRTRPTQIPPNVAMRHPDLETMYPDLQPDAETDSPKRLDECLDERQTMPTQAPSIQHGLPVPPPKQPSSPHRAASPILSSRAKIVSSAEPGATKAAEPGATKTAEPSATKAAEPAVQKTAPAKASILSHTPHQRATVPGKDRHRPTIIPEAAKETSTSSGPTETQAQIIGHLPNFSHTPYKGRTSRGSKAENNRMHGVAMPLSSAQDNPTPPRAADHAPQKAATPQNEPQKAPKAEMVEMSSLNASTTPARQHAPAARRPRSQALGNLSSIFKSDLKLSEISEPQSQDASDKETQGSDSRPAGIFNPYLKRRQAIRPQPSVKLDLDERTLIPSETDSETMFDEDSLKSDTNHILTAIEDGSRAIGEDENTLIVSPVLLNDIEPIPELQSPSLIQKPILQSLTPILQTRMSLTFVLQALQRSMLEDGRLTLSCREGAKTHVAILESGRMMWFETVVAGRVSSAENYLKDLPESAGVPAHELLALVKQKLTLPQAFSELDLDVTAIELCEKQLTTHIQSLHDLYDKPADIHRDIPLPWQPLLTQRPCQSLPASPILFNEFRKHAEAMPIPRNFHYMSFTMRPYRTPLNVAIELTAEENELLTAMKHPISIAELQKSGKSQCMTMLYRLVMFEFADCVN